ncbi:phospholipase D-like domain-containing protein [Salinarimonas ramus]|uniref:Phospholipase D n=1 Tax=Salinarimonas ramus TaxID=690164 RepID=A0A917V4J4_9HYPH|nr:phospholipase D-like domain-containing protein [Salinarimonas ramus]GGK36640.1 phospholipase D/transphosphatidylase [Salinarimonas ramus]
MSTTAARADDSPAPHRILRPGDTCWRIAHADRAGLVVDAQDYFRAVKEAMLAARHTIMLIGWDFDLRIQFEPDGATMEGPNALGPFLRWISKTRPELRIYVLKWDLGMIQALGRGSTPLMILDWTTSENIRFHLDGAHPPGAAHHQKIVAIDDVFAFCGGIDMTADRWDTRGHLDGDERRLRPSGRAYGPWHDATMALDGDAAKSLAEHARQRWKLATGEELEPPPARAPIWPSGVAPTFVDVDVGIARTAPLFGNHPKIFEVESLLLSCIREARETIYCESQYFASRTIAEVIAGRLREADGPQIVIVNPMSADGYLEAATMDTARARLLKLVRDADVFDRFRIYTPVTHAGEDIYVHAKILIVDDRLIRIGSSNLNNRSMGFDTECDVAIEAVEGAPDAAERRRRILDVRADLLAEHLATTPEAVEQAIAEHGLVGAVDRLSGHGRTLAPYEPDPIGPAEELLAENDLLDPERPPKWIQRAKATLMAPLR